MYPSQANRAQNIIGQLRTRTNLPPSSNYLLEQAWIITLMSRLQVLQQPRNSPPQIRVLPHNGLLMTRPAFRRVKVFVIRHMLNEWKYLMLLDVRM